MIHQPFNTEEFQIIQAIHQINNNMSSNYQQNVEIIFYNTCKQIRNLPRDQHGQLLSQSEQIVDNLVHKYDLLYIIANYLRQCKTNDVDPCHWVCSILILLTRESTTRANLVACYGLIEDMLQLLIDTDEYECLQPSALMVIHHVVVQGGCNNNMNTMIANILDTLLEVYWSESMIPIALEILNYFHPFLLLSEGYRSECIRRLNDEVTNIEKNELKSQFYHLLFVLLGDNPCFVVSHQHCQENRCGAAYEESQEKSCEAVLICDEC